MQMLLWMRLYGGQSSFFAYKLHPQPVLGKANLEHCDDEQGSQRSSQFRTVHVAICGSTYLCDA